MSESEVQADMSCDDTVGIVEDTTASSVRYRSGSLLYNEGLSGRGGAEGIGRPTTGSGCLPKAGTSKPS